MESINNVPSSSISIVEIAETKPLKLETVVDLNKEISTMLEAYAPKCSLNNASKSVEAFLHHESERIIKLENEESSMDMDQGLFIRSIYNMFSEKIIPNLRMPQKGQFLTRVL